MPQSTDDLDRNTRAISQTLYFPCSSILLYVSLLKKPATIMWSCFQTPAIFPNASTNGNSDITTQSDSSGEEVIDLRGDQFDESKVTGFKLTSWDIWALGLSTTFGGHFYLWSLGLTTGFGGLVVQTFLIFTGYAVLLLCMSELSSALPFAGDYFKILVPRKSSNVSFPLNLS